VSEKCARCGLSLALTPSGLCPRCLVRIVRQSAGTSSDSSEAARGDGADETSALRFGDFELLEEIAHGGMGVVWRARQISLNRVVALKMVLGGRFANETEVKRFRAEAEAAAQLEHPNIVPLYEVGEREGQPLLRDEAAGGRKFGATGRGSQFRGREKGGNRGRGGRRRGHVLPFPLSFRSCPGITGASSRLRSERNSRAARPCRPRCPLRAPTRHPPSRSQPANILLDDEGKPHVHRLRTGQTCGGRRQSHRERSDAGHAELHVPRSSGGQSQNNSRRHGHLQPGRDSLRTAHRPPPSGPTPPWRRCAR
jgi:hypothetical protein